ncbi:MULTISPECIES: 50S ribosomal protein L29 [Treponema]|jgi:ribosomal protein L29|uniref:Large ribosomal subunit protein uL29 n=4 Tax=Treponema denticola TaxID=158 RepID=RL29_TREDE|nr:MULTISPECIES: 50S ribosomal protein L29 [Treponema]Q73PM4.1 RecName: Full=Large ribosomal subunit protein uL29; AltName: Full=50S ribosomal protein L29 [Treponema denticola ATCC 35405]AAS11266.1 ribosomal protein L29 [Treponema denticola ATCC 35405]EGC76426.1 50S ribosomal protein L29 [Treponema denticola F0402]EMB20432.1 50S ribosomal protein L29 [Treponema denticola OTK]EMB27617.1 50S ribosomal protein L29 [Treponema denticola MYR-T]EMB27689.1 50S ribosomal protein L29 [Treponema dentico
MKNKSKYREMSYKELVSKRNDLKQKYMDLRFQAVVGHLDNPLEKRSMRREIAMLNTFIRQKELAGEGAN